MTDASIDASFGTEIVKWGWFMTTKRSPVKGFIVKRYTSGALWIGYCDGGRTMRTAKLGSPSICKIKHFVPTTINLKEAMKPFYAISAVLTAMIGWHMHGSVFFTIIDFMCWPLVWVKWLISHDVNLTLIKSTFAWFFH